MSAIPTPAGSFALPAAKLRTMVSESSTFQTEGNHADATEALDKIFLRDAIETERRPMANIRIGQQFSYSMVSGGSQSFLRPSGELFLYLNREISVDHFNDQLSAEIDAANYFGQVIDDVVALSGKDVHLPIIGTQLMTFEPTDEDEWPTLGRFYYHVTAVQWGMGQ